MKIIRKIAIIFIVGIIAMIVAMFKQKHKCEVPDEVYKILEEVGVENATITRLGDFSDMQLQIEDIQITDNELNRYVEMQLESFTEIIQLTDRDIVYEGDVVYVSYMVTYNGNVINQVKSDNLVVGAGIYDKAFEETLVGRRVGQPFSVELNIPETEEYATFSIMIESINYFKTYELTEAFVKEKFGMQSIQEYYDDCRNTLKEEKEQEMRQKAEKELFELIIENSEFSIKQEEIAKYSIRIVQEQEMVDYCGEVIGKEGVNYRQCSISIKKLEELKEYICDFHSENVGIECEDDKLELLLDSIVAVGIYTDKNKVFVQIVDCNKEKVSTFKKYIIDSEYIIFEDSDNYIDNSDYFLEPGEQIKMYAEGAYREWSIGFRCKKLNSSGNYIYGFITAGHGTKKYGAVYSSSGDYIGYVYTRCYDNYGTTDAAFVYVTNSKYGCTRMVYGYGYSQYISANYISKYVTGATIYMAGCMSGLTSGTIESTSTYMSAKVDGVYYKTYDVVKANYIGQGGDSGGLVFSIENGSKYVAGIHKGSSGNYSYFVKAKNIKEDLGIVLY